jgi:DNA-binding transcriptional ArsR family regulator
MVNDDYQPSEAGEKVLSVFKSGRENSGPWGRANPRYLIDRTDLSKSNVEYQLRRLNDAGWIDKVARGLYEYVEDPREQQSPSDCPVELRDGAVVTVSHKPVRCSR